MIVPPGFARIPVSLAPAGSERVLSFDLLIFELPRALRAGGTEAPGELLADPEAAFPAFTPERDRMEAGWLAAPPDPAEAFREADAALARWDAGLPDTADRRPWFVRRYWRVRDRRAGLAN